MKLLVRPIGNSLGVIVPKNALQAWGVAAGDFLELGDHGIRPSPKSAPSTEALDEHKRKLAAEVASRFTAQLIRAKSLANLHRWKKNDVWGPAYAEWEKILKTADDGALFAAMLGRDQHANQLRQSAPYVGLLPREVVRRLNEEITG